MRSLLIAMLLVAAPAATAQERSGTRTVEVQLSNFDFSPATIRLRAGEPVVLRLVNAGRSGHNFSAPQFFAAATDVSGAVRNGKVEVAGRQSRDVRLTPARGTYRLSCTRTLHTAFGMSGQIVVV